VNRLSLAWRRINRRLRACNTAGNADAPFRKQSSPCEQDALLAGTQHGNRCRHHPGHRMRFVPLIPVTAVATGVLALLLLCGPP
jgi:hypothetical protein